MPKFEIYWYVHAEDRNNTYTLTITAPTLEDAEKAAEEALREALSDMGGCGAHELETEE